jgi:anti-sigma B factor antagonist
MVQPFQLSVERFDDAACSVAVVGELELATAPAFRRAVSGLLGSGMRRMLVDLRHTDFLDSTGLGALVWAQFRMRSAGGELAVAGAQEPVRQTISVSGLADLIELVDTSAEALVRLGIQTAATPASSSAARSTSASVTSSPPPSTA